ncbi:MAG TPA: long-chain fatty acid--CoA ligase [Gemmatimonadaceae bacterium]|nr:long-chain fatty acid--CoA ligase [Gemmatimonadaceae bacterium]
MRDFVPLRPPTEPTLNRLFAAGVARHGALPALVHRDGGRWIARSYDDVAAEVRRLAQALDALGVSRGDRVVLLSENRPEWAVADYAVLALGGVTVPLYPTLPAAQVAPIVHDSGAHVVVASTVEQAGKVLDACAAMPEVAHLVVCDAVDDALAGRAAREGVMVHHYGELVARAIDDEAWLDELRARADAVGPDDLATLIYTSGTTGAPKGVELTHFNLAAMVAATVQHGSITLHAGESALSILPLSHVFERAADYLFWQGGVAIHYAQSMKTVARDLEEVRPHHMIAVPRLFEKSHAAVTGTSGVKGRIARWAVGVGARVVEARTHGRAPSAALRAQYAAADRLVYSKLRERVGGRMRTFICGGAPLAPAAAALFHAAGMPIYEGYGLTETSPVLAANRPGDVRLGTVGVPYPGVELRIGAEGEIQARGPSVTRGYWRNPEATAAAFTADGFFRTGDVGHFDADGFLHVTDRLKDIIVTAGGKNIAPQPLELLVSASPWVAQAIMLGDRRPYPVMLVVPDFEALDAWASDAGIDATDRAAFAMHERLRELLEREVHARLAGLARYEQPKKVAVLPAELTIEEGLLTPSLKVRRRAVEARFRDVIERLYAG